MKKIIVAIAGLLLANAALANTPGTGWIVNTSGKSMHITYSVCALGKTSVVCGNSMNADLSDASHGTNFIAVLLSYNEYAQVNTAEAAGDTEPTLFSAYSCI